MLRNGYAADERLIEKLRVHVKECAGPWKYPRWIDIRPDLPRTATGKIQRFKLRELEAKDLIGCWAVPSSRKTRLPKSRGVFFAAAGKFYNLGRYDPRGHAYRRRPI